MGPLERYSVGDDILEIFMSKIDKKNSGCWVWGGTMNQFVTPSILHKNKRYTVKTSMYVTKFPDEFDDWRGKSTLTVKNTCGDYSCCNPDHMLILGSLKYEENFKGKFVYNNPKYYYQKYVADDKMVEFLKSQVEISGQCWNWPKLTGGPRPMVKYHGEQYSVGLILYITEKEGEFEGWNPKARHMHSSVSCGNAHCINPEHLIVTGTEKWFWSNVDTRESADDCWEWLGNDVDRGYARCVVNGYRRKNFPHRLAYQYHSKTKLGNKSILLYCNNKSCCNPSHMEILSDGGDLHDYSIGLIKKIVKDTPLKIKEIAHAFGVTDNVIRAIKNGKTV